jgi:hypothetical protein
MRIDGPYIPLSPEIDFSQWTWGDFEESTFKPIADRIAEVLWGEIVDSIRTGEPRLDTDNDGRGSISIIVDLMGTHFLYIPLAQVEIDDSLLVAKDQPGWELDYEATIAQQQQAIDILQGWIANIQAQLATARKEQEKARKEQPSAR